MKRKLFSLLVLLLTAVTGAWADATIAKLWVGNSEEVTSEGTITGTGATEGTASVAIENGSMVLTLNNFKFNGCGYNDSGIYYQSNANGNTPLIIKIEGDNEITLPGGTDKSLYGFFLYGGNGDHVFTITGSGSLTVTVGDGNLSNGIFVQQADLVLAGGTVTANVGNAGAEFKSLGVSVPQGTLTIDGGTLKASGSTTSASRGVNVNNNVTIKSGELEAYGYSKGIKNSGGDALVFAEGVTPTLFKAGENEASATDVSKYEGQKYLHVVCTGGDEPAAPTGDGVNYALSVGTNEHGTVKFFVGQDEVTKAKEGETVTIVVTPDENWSIGNVTGQWIAAVAKAPRRRATIGLLQDIDLGDGSTDQTTGAVTYSFTMERANAVISAAYKKLLTHADISITAPNQVFNGQDLQPVVTVKDGSTTLVKNKDYTLNIPECINVGEYAVVVTGKGFYTGMTSVTYKVTGRPINTLMISEVKPLTYTGKQHRPLVTVSFGETTLVKDQDYYLGYTNNINAGTAKMSIMGLGNYTGYAFLEFDITKAPLTVKADDAMVISGKQPSFTASYEGFVNNQTEAVLEGELAFACDYTTESAVGSTFAITPSGLTAKNYDITFVPGKLTVLVDQAAVDQAAADDAMGKISAIGEVAYNETSKGLIDAAREAYNALTDAQKALVTNLETLTNAETTYANLKAAAEKAAADQLAADDVIAKITAIGEVAYNETSKGLIDAARNAYTALTEDQKALVNNYEVLTTAETTYANLKAAAEKAAADKAAADDVIAKINAIGEVAYTDACKALIDAARNAYSELTEDQKALVTNYEVLTTAETTYANLKAAAEKAAADKAAADDVIAKINAIGEVAYTEACKNLIDAARNAYTALTEDQKALVTNLSVLTDAETAYAELAQIATGISTIKAIAGKTIYDMNGRKVTVPSKKGMYIINGKKVVVK